jgi:hypothetical protein
MENNITKHFYTVVNAWAPKRSFILAMIVLGKYKRRGF